METLIKRVDILKVEESKTRKELKDFNELKIIQDKLFEDIIYIKADGNYIDLVSSKKEFPMKTSLKKIQFIKDSELEDLRPPANIPYLSNEEYKQKLKINHILAMWLTYNKDFKVI